MKKVILLFAIIFTSYCVSAQINKQFIPKNLKPSSFNFDNYRMQRLMYDNKRSMQKLLAKDSMPNLDNMPVAGNIAAPKYIGNNKQGFDVFTSPLDNMAIAKPDNTFK